MGKLGKEIEDVINGITNAVILIAKIVGLLALVLVGVAVTILIAKEINMRTWRKRAEGLPDCGVRMPDADADAGVDVGADDGADAGVDDGADAETSER